MISARITEDQPAIVLAPMEGVTDAPMRALLSEIGGITFCVSEFLRISQGVPPDHTFLEHMPEFINQCRTPSGISVQIQLLGGDEEKMAQSALRAYQLGASAIDINFGCPSPQVNRHDGGASLLRYPHRIRQIVAAVRSVIPIEIPVSAKLRLGWESMPDIHINAEQAALGGASWITIHARTKAQGYTPPAHWNYIGDVKRNLNIPVVANGEIWTREDFLRCQEVTRCQHFMLGRGILANPYLGIEIAAELGILNNAQEVTPFDQSPEAWESILKRFSEIAAPFASHSHYTACRIKQWLRIAHMKYSLGPWLDDIKRAKDQAEIFSILKVFMRKA